MAYSMFGLSTLWETATSGGNPTEEEMDGLGEDAAEAATLRALDFNLRRYYAGLNLEGKRKAVEFLAILAGNVDFRA